MHKPKRGMPVLLLEPAQGLGSASSSSYFPYSLPLTGRWNSILLGQIGGMSFSKLCCNNFWLGSERSVHAISFFPSFPSNPCAQFIPGLSHTCAQFLFTVTICSHAKYWKTWLVIICWSATQLNQDTRKLHHNLSVPSRWGLPHCILDEQWWW